MQLPRSTLPTAFLLALIPAQTHAQSLSPATGASMSAATPDHAAVIHRFYEQCINEYHSEIIPELFTANAVFHSSTGDGTGLDSVRKTVDNVHTLFPNHHFTVDDVVVNGDKAAARWSMTALNTAPIAGIPPTGRPITNRAIVFYRFEGNKIAELWLQVDQIGVFRQIGVQLPGGPSPQQLPNAPSAAHPAQQ